MDKRHLVNIFMTLVSLCLATSANAFLLDLLFSSKDPLQNKSFDYIIVGSGSAGAVVANRLSENKNIRVLLLEAGGEPSFLSKYPIFWPFLMNTPMDWSYRTTPQPQCCSACEDLAVPVPRGKALGGTSSINAMMYVRGNKEDYNRWEWLGNPNWGYQSVLPFFLKSENQMNKKLLQDTTYHRAGGPLNVRDMGYHTRIVKAFVEAGPQVGYPETPDINGINQMGVIAEQVTNDAAGDRWSTKYAYLDPASGRPNLVILSQAFATKINFNREKRATGVTFNYKGQSITATANLEVIVSAGPINSPQLLMLSGVGPEDHLKSLNINIVANVPGVGENLQEHPMTWGLIWKVPIKVEFLNIKNILSSALSLVKVILSRILTGTSALSANAGLEGMAFVKTSYANESGEWPDMQMQLIALSDGIDYGESIRKVSGFSVDMFNKYFKDGMNGNGFTILPILISADSRGNIRLASTDPLKYPIIDPKFFSNPKDEDKLVQGLQIAYNLGESAAFKAIGAKFYNKPVPGCEGIPIGTTAYFKCMVKILTVTAWHPAGTCKMGPSTDPMAVVDARLRVYGVTHLRVIDSSIMSVITSGNTNAPSIMIGEKGASMVIEDMSSMNRGGGR